MYLTIECELKNGTTASLLTHEASWICWIRADLPIDFDKSLLHYPLHLVSSQSVFEAVSQEHYKWNTLPQLVGASGGPGRLVGRHKEPYTIDTRRGYIADGLQRLTERPTPTYVSPR